MQKITKYYFLAREEQEEEEKEKKEKEEVIRERVIRGKGGRGSGYYAHVKGIRCTTLLPPFSYRWL